MSKKLYKQCTLVRNIESGTIQTVSYIPVEFAKLDSVLKLQDEEGLWTSGWKVVGVGHDSTDSPPDFHKAIRGHRKNTGDSLLKS